MRFLAPALLALLLAACARAPRAVEPVPTAPTAAPRPASALIGLTASELITRFGQPSFQVREGQGLKLQWARNGCVMDTYLYPPGTTRGGEEVTHVDTRRPSGDALAQPNCVDLLLR